MKLFLATAALMFSVAAHAGPKLGDYSEFQLTVSQGPQSMVGTYILAITAENGDDVVVKTTVHFDGQPDQLQEENVKKAQLLGTERIADLLANCQAYGGAPEQLSTAAGIIPSCKMTTPGENGAQPGQMWIGQVPFGIVKQIQTSPEGQTFTLELKKFIVGQ